MNLEYLKILHSRKDFYQALILVRVSSVTKGMAKIIQGIEYKILFQISFARERHKCEMAVKLAS